MVVSVVFVFCASFILSVMMIPLIMRISKRHALYDGIDDRTIHNKKISRLGGFAIFAGFFITFWVFNIPAHVHGFSTAYFVAGMGIAFLTGFIDDLVCIRARYKLVMQILAGICVAMSGLKIDTIVLHNAHAIHLGALSGVITVCWVVVFMNAINLIDGMDGLASGIVFIANIFIFIIAIALNNTLVALLTVCASGSILGFYIYNYPPAKIFMGDGGAYFLGYLYATISLMGMAKKSVAVLFLVPIILLLIPLTDIVQVVITRMRRGTGIFIPDQNHLHHRLMRLGYSTRGVLVVMYCCSIILGIASLIMFESPAQSLNIFAIIVMLVLLLAYILGHAERVAAVRKSNAADKGGKEGVVYGFPHGISMRKID